MIGYSLLVSCSLASHVPSMWFIAKQIQDSVTWRSFHKRVALSIGVCFGRFRVDVDIISRQMCCFSGMVRFFGRENYGLMLDLRWGYQDRRVA